MSLEWVDVELESVDLGDTRLNRRLKTIVKDLSQNPETSLPDACDSWNNTKATYRFLNNPYVESESIYDAHCMATHKRIAEEDVALAVQDTTYLNFGIRKSSEGLGPVSKKNEKSVGFLMHSAMAVSTSGVPLGIIGQKFIVRDLENTEKPKNRPIEEKESFRWLELLNKNSKIPDSTHIITVADRESDIYEFFVNAQQGKQDFIIRASTNRKLANKGDNGKAERLFDFVSSQPILGENTITVSPAGNQKERETTLTLQVAKVEIVPPKRLLGLPNITLTIIRAIETTPIEDKKPLEWYLLTTLEINTLEDAVCCVTWYTYRWRIERYHYTLKSGCAVEELQLETAKRLQCAIAVYSIVAWHLLYLTYYSRECPDADCSNFLTEIEWQTLHIVTHKELPPSEPPSLQTVIMMIARLGGFLGRRHDGNPGVKVLWRGYRRLQDYVTMKSILHKIS